MINSIGGVENLLARYQYLQLIQRLALGSGAMVRTRCNGAPAAAQPAGLCRV